MQQMHDGQMHCKISAAHELAKYGFSHYWKALQGQTNKQTNKQ